MACIAVSNQLRDTMIDRNDGKVIFVEWRWTCYYKILLFVDDDSLAQRFVCCKLNVF